ncbi:MAG: TonB family protein [Acidobacteriaceae bacterium]
MPLAFAEAATSPKDVAKSVKGKIVFLRGMEAGDTLSFDAQGSEIGTVTTGSFASSALEVDKVHLSRTSLDIAGKRGVLILNTASHSPSFKDVRFMPTAASINLKISIDPANPDFVDAAVRRVLAFNLQDALAGKSRAELNANIATIASLSPVSADFPRSKPNPTAAPALIAGAYRVQGGVSPPRLLHSVDAIFPPGANRKKQGDHLCVLSLIVDVNGNPTHIRIARSAGLDFDTEAVAALTQFRFLPAEYLGKAVPAWIETEINFQLY